MEDPTEPFKRSMHSFSDALNEQLKVVGESLAEVARTIPPLPTMSPIIKTVAGIMPVSREMLYPTPLAAEVVERHKREREEQDVRQAARHAELVASPDPVVRATADLHSPKEVFPSWLECKGCDYAGHDGEPPQWPCRTWVLLDETVAANA